MPRIAKVILLIDTARGYGRGVLSGIAKYSRLHGSWIFFWRTLFYREYGRKEVVLSRLKGLGADGIIMREQKRTEEILATCGTSYWFAHHCFTL